jgi:hypothetical protein
MPVWRKGFFGNGKPRRTGLLGRKRMIGEVHNEELCNL